MKKLYSLLVLGSALFVQQAAAQTFSNTCSTPIPVNSVGTFTFPAATSTPNLDFANDYGCTSPANNAQWFYFQACMPGTVNFIFSSALSSGSDVDFVAWGPLTAPTDCGLTAGQILDCSNAVGYNDTMTFNVLAGSYYKFLVSNPMNGVGSYSFQAMSVMPVLYDSCPSCSGILPVQEICQVTTDPVMNRNIIIWEKDTTYTGDYVIEKESTVAGVFTTIATIANNDTSAYMDSVSNAAIQSVIYRVSTTDTCGNLNSAGVPHMTIHLLTSVSSSTGYPQLAWNSYAGFYYGTHYIYRGSSPATLALYDSVSASINSYTDVAAVTGMNYYAIAVFPAVPCQPSRSMAMPCMSNTSPVMFTGINEHEFDQLNVGPNPANNTLNFSLGATVADIRIQMIDVTGRIVLRREFRNASSGAIDLSGIANGSYVVKFTSENGSSHRNIIVVR